MWFKKAFMFFFMPFMPLWFKKASLCSSFMPFNALCGLKKNLYVLLYVLYAFMVQKKTYMILNG
jgi:hypothetical protein